MNYRSIGWSVSAVVMTAAMIFACKKSSDTSAGTSASITALTCASVTFSATPTVNTGVTIVAKCGNAGVAAIRPGK
jgi:hypothetical protein